jgi:hypothetical protein
MLLLAIRGWLHANADAPGRAAGSRLTNLRLRETRAGSVPLFSGCSLE